MSKGGYFFISYAHENKDIAKELHSFLETNGIDAWMDEKIASGTLWNEEIKSRIEDAAGVFVILSDELNKRDGSVVFEEINAANQAQKNILPIKLCSKVAETIEALLSDFQYHDLSRDFFPDHFSGLFESGKEFIFEWCDKWENDSKLLAHPSWLPTERKQQLVASMKRHRIQLEKHRAEHLSHLAERRTENSYAEPAWWRLSATHSHDGNRAIIGFRHKQCKYRIKDDGLRLGCFNCGYYAGADLGGSGATLIQLKQQLLNGLRQVFDHSSGVEFDVIEFLTDGSFLDTDEYEFASQKAVLGLLSKLPWLRRVLIESRPEFIDCQRLVSLLNSLNPVKGRREKELEVGIGLETADDFIRNVCINKGFGRKDFEHALDEIIKVREKGYACSAVCYLIVKPAFLTEREAIADTVATLRYLQGVAADKGYPDLIRPKLEPAAVSRGTMLSLLFKENKYTPLNYWSILEILTRAVTDTEISSIAELIRIGAREDMDDVAKVPAIYIRREGRSRFDQIDFAVYTAIQNFNRHGGSSPSQPTAKRSDDDVRPAVAHLLDAYSSIRSALAQEDRSQFAYDSRSTWAHSVCENTVEETAIDRFFAENETLITENEGSSFLEEIYLALDVIENLDPKKSPEFLRSATPLLYAGDKDELAKLIEGAFNSDLVGVRVVSLDAESDMDLENDDRAQPFYRAFLEVQDFITRKVYPIWTQIDISHAV